MQINNYAGLSDDQLADITRDLDGQRTLDDMLKWALRSDPAHFTPTIVSDVVAQDEFTNDVIVPWRDNLVLVYDST
jgi:hypothetical protein